MFRLKYMLHVLKKIDSYLIKLRINGELIANC